eukprot:Tbor_TRINITY_DN5429_c3_g3::TRINITY_DN5429_c3_g3_i2::g.24688::m.24688
MPLLGNMLLSAAFIAGGIDKFNAPNETMMSLKAGPLPQLVKQHAQHTITTDEYLIIVQCISISLVAAGLMVAFFRGCLRSAAALYLIAIVSSCTYISYVDINDPTKMKRDDIIQFMKNLAIIGGLMNCICSGGNNCRSAAPKKAKKD